MQPERGKIDFLRDESKTKGGVKTKVLHFETELLSFLFLPRTDLKLYSTGFNKADTSQFKLQNQLKSLKVAASIQVVMLIRKVRPVCAKPTDLFCGFLLSS